MAGALEVKIIGDPSSIKRAFGEVENAGSHLGGFLSGAFKVGVAGAAAGLGALTVAAKIGWDEFSQGTKVAAQTNAVIKSTGDVSHVTAKQVDSLGTSIMRKSGIDDEAIKSGENMLLTFTNIRNEAGKGNDVFNQTTKVLTDMSVATGQDMTKASVMLGKAINDPIAGIGALSRVGVTFTEQQKEQIKALVDSGHTMDAQKVILHELNKEFGGSAEAAGKTLPGQLQILKQEFNNFAGDMVGKVVPVLTDFVNFARDHMPEVKAVVTDVFSRIGEVFQQVWPTIKQWLEAEWVFFRDNLLPIIKQLGEIFIDTVTRIAGVVQEHMPEIKRILGFVGDVIKEIAKVAIPLLKFAFEEVLPTAIGIAITAIDTIVTALRGIGRGITTVVGWFKDLPGNIAGAIDDGIHIVKTAITGLFGNVIDWVKEALGIKSPSAVFHEIGVNMIKGFINGVGSMAGALAHKVKQLVTQFLPDLNQPGLDPGTGGRFGPGVAGGGDHLVPQVHRALAYAQSHGWHGSVISGYRTYAEQAALYQRYLAGGPIAAPPGSSSHERGEAVDVSDAGTFDRIMAGAPRNDVLYNLVPGDFNHFSVTGHATGGIINKPLHLFGEAGPEAVIPLGTWMDGWQQVKTATQDGWVQVKTTTHETTTAVNAHHATTRELLQKILNAVTPLNNSLRDIVGAINKSGVSGRGGAGGAGGSSSSGSGSGWVQVATVDGSSGWVQVYPGSDGWSQVHSPPAGGGGAPPRMAAGGIVRRPTLALIGEAGPEAVVPLSRTLGGVHLHVSLEGANIYGDDTRKVAKQLINDIVAELTLYQQAGGQLTP